MWKTTIMLALVGGSSLLATACSITPITTIQVDYHRNGKVLAVVKGSNLGKNTVFFYREDGTLEKQVDYEGKEWVKKTYFNIDGTIDQ